MRAFRGLLARLAHNEVGLTTVDLRSLDGILSCSDACLDLGTALRNNSQVRTLSLRHTGIGPRGAERLVRGLVGNAADHKATDTASLSSSSLLLPSCGLVELDLRANDIADEGAAALADLLVSPSSSSSSSPPTIATLDLWDNAIGAEGAASLASALRSPASWGLRTLNMGQNVLQDQGGALLAAGLEGHRGLTSLSLMKNSLYDETCVGLGRVLASPDCALLSLCIRSNAVGDLGAEALSRGIVGSSSGDGEGGGGGGASSLLKTLDMRSNEVGGRGLDSLCRAVETPSTSLETVDLRKQSRTGVNTAYHRGGGWQDMGESAPLYDLDADEPMGWSAR